MLVHNLIQQSTLTDKIMLVHNLIQQSTLTDKIYTTNKSNMHNNLLDLINCKKFLLHLIFILLTSILNIIIKIGPAHHRHDRHGLKIDDKWYLKIFVNFYFYWDCSMFLLMREFYQIKKGISIFVPSGP
jgi:hypothetical protein